MSLPTSRAPYICRLCTQRLLPSRRSTSKPLNQRYQSTNTTRPYRLAVIGSGPAGFYATYRILNKLQDATVDMYEQLPAPYGLVRYGVAPDHPEVKVGGLPCITARSPCVCRVNVLMVDLELPG